MNPLWLSALVMGAAGSAHCIGMCGPIAMAVPGMGDRDRSRIRSTALLNGGRLATYALLGLAFGGLGEGLRLAGLQRWVSLAAGALLLLSVLMPALIERAGARGGIAMGLSRLRGMMARHLRRTAPEAIFLSGALNGLLPCGLVYAAAIGAAAIGGALNGAWFMLLFGAGTLPALVALRLGGSFAGPALRAKLRRLSPVVVGCVGLLLILRGSQLGIPYVSPAAPVANMVVGTCH